MKTAVIYARYSSDTQTEQSIEGQLRVCNEYAKNNDILILCLPKLRQQRFQRKNNRKLLPKTVP